MSNHAFKCGPTYWQEDAEGLAVGTWQIWEVIQRANQVVILFLDCYFTILVNAIHLAKFIVLIQVYSSNARC